MIDCNICKKHILFECHLICCICQGYCHVTCLPNITKLDQLYAKDQKSNWICLKCIQEIFPFNHIDNDNDFIKYVSESCEEFKTIPLDILKDMSFNPFELNEDSTFSSLPSLDPDQNYFNENIYHINSNYYLESDFNKLYQKQYKNSDGISLVHVNIRSLLKNMNNFELYLDGLEIDFNVIGVSETWIKESNVSLS